MKYGFLVFIATILVSYKFTFAQNVGIGINTPAAKLHVNGDFKLQHGVTVNTVSADTNFLQGSDSTLPTQKAISRYVKGGTWAHISNAPTELVFVNRSGANPTFGLDIQGNYLYATTGGQSRLQIFDITDPLAIVLKGSINTNQLSSESICVNGNYAYIASVMSNRVTAFNISNPENIVQAGFTNANMNRPWGLTAQGNYLYVTSVNNNRLCIYDISNPNNIIPKGFTSTNISSPNSVVVQGNYAYVASGLNDLFCIFDISNPDNIVARGFTSTNLDGPLCVKVIGNYAYVTSSGNARLCIFDISNPDNIVARGFASTVGNPETLCVEGSYAFVASLLDKQMMAYDISNPDNIVFKNSIDFTNQGIVNVRAMALKGRNIFTSTGYSGQGFLGFAFGARGILSVNSMGVAVSPLLWESNNTHAFRSGNVGIGTSNPTVPLEVVSITNMNVPNFGYLNPGGNTGFFGSAATIPVSIKASGRIVSSEFNAVSDQRIKRNIITSSSQSDLQKLLALRVADYQLQDSIHNGKERIKGFIAQEIETIIPQVVRVNGDYIPDIYSLSTSTQYNVKDKTLRVAVSKPHALKVGDHVKVFSLDGTQMQQVSVINSETEFTLGNWDMKNAGMNPVEKVFVWGKWVEDFRSIDYNQVFVMGISAIQQLAKENEELKVKTESLQQQIDELRKLINPAKH